MEGLYTVAVMLGSTVGVQLFSVVDSSSTRHISLPAISTSFQDRDEESSSTSTCTVPYV